MIEMKCLRWMPAQSWVDPAGVLGSLSHCHLRGDAVEFGWGYGTVPPIGADCPRMAVVSDIKFKVESGRLRCVR